MRGYLKLIVLVPLAILLIAFSVANRQMVGLSFDPLNTSDPAYVLNVPMFVVIFGATAIGLLLGGVATWFSQGRYRKQARDGRKETAKWRYEAEKHTRETELPAHSATGDKPVFPMLPPAKSA